MNAPLLDDEDEGMEPPLEHGNVIGNEPEDDDVDEVQHGKASPCKLLAVFVSYSSVFISHVPCSFG